MLMRDGLCFLLHLWMCTPQATFSEFRLARKGVVEYAWIVWSDPVVLALCRIWLWTMPWVFVALVACVRMSLCRLECRSASLVTLGGISLFFPLFGAKFGDPLRVGLHH